MTFLIQVTHTVKLKSLQRNHSLNQCVKLRIQIRMMNSFDLPKLHPIAIFWCGFHPKSTYSTLWPFCDKTCCSYLGKPDIHSTNKKVRHFFSFLLQIKNIWTNNEGKKSVLKPYTTIYPNNPRRYRAYVVRKGWVSPSWKLLIITTS